ncbi:ATP-binding cassette domain-containing protein [Streptosporangium soli]|nr:ATP-binding cassette domain-containing protein [Streptosporangium sp. KLBMP 9127]
MSNGFAVEDLAQGYGVTPFINGLTFDISQGIVGLLGPNGAGKTTLLRTVATVLPPRGGTVTVLGRKLERKKDILTARRRLGYLPQDFGYYPSFTVYEFVRYCAWLRRIPRRRVREATMTALESVDLADKARVRMKALSGGMLRRAGIAQAVVGDVGLVLLDEPTVGLDPEQRLAFRQLIRTLSDRATIVLSTHLVEDVAAVCDRLAIMSDGRIVYTGTPAELAASSAPNAQGDTAIERGYISVLRDGAANR